MKIIRDINSSIDGQSDNDEFILTHSEIQAIINGAIAQWMGEDPSGEAYYGEDVGDCPPVEWVLLHRTHLFAHCDEQPSLKALEWKSSEE